MAQTYSKFDPGEIIRATMLTFEVGDIVEVTAPLPDTYYTGLVGVVTEKVAGDNGGSLRVAPIWILSAPRVRSFVPANEKGTFLLFAYKFSLITHLDTPSEVVENK